MGQEKVLIVGGNNFVVSVERISLKRAGHRVADGGRDLESARRIMAKAVQAGASVALVNKMEEGDERVFAKEIKERDSGIVVVTFSYNPPGFGDLHVPRQGGPPDWDLLPKAISSIHKTKAVRSR